MRFRAPDEGTTSFADVIRGTVTVDNRTIEDFVLHRTELKQAVTEAARQEYLAQFQLD